MLAWWYAKIYCVNVLHASMLCYHSFIRLRGILTGKNRPDYCAWWYIEITVFSPNIDPSIFFSPNILILTDRPGYQHLILRVTQHKRGCKCHSIEFHYRHSSHDVQSGTLKPGLAPVRSMTPGQQWMCYMWDGCVSVNSQYGWSINKPGFN